MFALTMTVMSTLKPFISEHTVPVGTVESIQSKLLVNVDLVVQEIGLLLIVAVIAGMDALYIGGCFKIAVQFKILCNVFSNIDVKERRKVIEAVQHHDFLLG